MERLGEPRRGRGAPKALGQYMLTCIYPPQQTLNAGLPLPTIMLCMLDRFDRGHLGGHRGCPSRKISGYRAVY